MIVRKRAKWINWGLNPCNKKIHVICQILRPKWRIIEKFPCRSLEAAKADSQNEVSSPSYFSTMCLSLPIQTCFLCDLEKGTSLLISFTSNKIRLIYFTINCPPNLWHTVSMSEWMYRIFRHKPVSWSSVGLEAVCGTGIDRESAGKVPCRHPFPFRFIPAVVSAFLSLRKSSLRLCFPWTQFWMH